jgi:acid stress-induced BolA-like protein IbaG/YrbA
VPFFRQFVEENDEHALKVALFTPQEEREQR